MKLNALKATALAAALAVGGYFLVGPVFAHGPGNWGGGFAMNHGPMGPGMMGGQGYGMMGGQGYGMHGSMMGTGTMGSGPGAEGACPFQSASLEEALTVDRVTQILEQRLAHMGNDRLKVGTVAEKDDNTIVAEIVTVDGSLVQKLEFDRKTGSHRPVR